MWRVSRITSFSEETTWKRIWSYQTFMKRTVCPYSTRSELWNEEKKRQIENRLDGATSKTIQVTFSDGNSVDCTSGTKTPTDFLEALHKPLDFQPLVAKINGNQLLDMSIPIEDSCSLQYLGFDSDEGKRVFWHSAAHLLGQALECKFQKQLNLCNGPSLAEGGFYYEMHFNNKKSVLENDFQDLLTFVKKSIKEKSSFERLQVSREFAIEMFHDNWFKLETLNKIPSDQSISLYRCGDFIDLCRGPHVPHTGLFKAFDLTHCGASHWNGNSDAEMLQRVYGISFPSKQLYKEWKDMQEEAKRRDHRIIGKKQNLFMFHSLSPGSCFLLPHGTRIFNKLCNFIREEYNSRGYQEVITPLIYKQDLWEQSGHLENYKDDMYMVSEGIHVDSASHTKEKEVFGLKPMNCPGHCLIFRESREYSYRDLPVRFADFSALHRNEASGSLTGLTRVRRFHQDDAHIFCTTEQIQDEIRECLGFIKHVYGIFGFDFQLKLSTRPEKFMGDLPSWDHAEMQLRNALEEFGHPWEINEGDGAFYGPKIDISVTDALRRQHQCATIQLDFQLPQRFKLSYDGSDGKEYTPIIIHRAILGSVERMLAILMEHTAGKWPLWLSPRQVSIIPIGSTYMEYAEMVAKKLEEEGFHIEIISSNKTLNKKIRESQMLAFNYILVLGDEELNSNTVNVRTRDNVVHGRQSLSEFISHIKISRDNYE